MSRLYALNASAANVAADFGVSDAPAVRVPSETIEGSPGLVILQKDGRRLLKPMSWGFPRLTREMRLRGDPPGRIGLVADLTNAMWEQLVTDPRYRCLIPLTHFANPNGEPGEKARSWFSMKDAQLMAWAGFCRNTPGFGPVYAGMTMTANALVMPHNDRMPVLLEPADYARWLHGSVRDVIAFQFAASMAAERMTVEHSEDRWRSGKLPANMTTSQMALL